jgi:hypothetical protein
MRLGKLIIEYATQTHPRYLKNLDSVLQYFLVARPRWLRKELAVDNYPIDLRRPEAGPIPWWHVQRCLKQHSQSTLMRYGMTSKFVEF